MPAVMPSAPATGAAISHFFMVNLQEMPEKASGDAIRKDAIITNQTIRGTRARA
jgi:hypothetical protein